jgi:hypothetical protein
MASCLEEIFSKGLVGVTNKMLDGKVKEITMNYEKLEMELIFADNAGQNVLQKRDLFLNGSSIIEESKKEDSFPISN